MVSQAKKVESVLIAKIVGVHALKGEVRVLPYGEIDWITGGECLYPAPKGGKPSKESEDTLKVLALRPHKGVVLITFEGTSSIEEAKALVGLDLYVDADRLPELKPGEYYHQDLIDMEVFDASGTSLGKIAEVITTGANDVYQVTGPKGEMLLPALKEIIVSVDVAKNKMVVEPKGYEPEAVNLRMISRPVLRI